ncbi:general substrate transporter [Lentinula lateritia]|uniref:General substrate transporter n=1 Tax=Lentinula lateritia TaxID=40482 RepID=A0ABQ8VX74_9AGAR|nr:general substrate transporter [Lentinula lateritia]
MGSVVKSERVGLFQNVRVYWLAFIAYWGILLFGYDTGIAGGVVGNLYFEETFGIANSTGTINTKKSDDVSSNVVSVLQAGAFFGALVSAPVSAKFGRKWPLFIYTLIFAIGAILTIVPSGSNPGRGLGEIYAGRVISGFGIGAITAVSPAFVSECSPKEVRGRITGLFQVMVASGIMISYFINLGVGLHVKNNPKIWRIPFGLQLVPAGMMALGLLTVKESPRYLASVGRNEEAINNLAYLRRSPADSESVVLEMAEIEAAIQEERLARVSLGWREAFFGKGNAIRFLIAFMIFLLQQWSGQNSVTYYAPQIFASIGYTGTKNSLLASGVLGAEFSSFRILDILLTCRSLGVVKVVTVSTFVAFGVERFGRKRFLFISSMGMGILFFIIGALLKTHPPPAASANDAPSSPSRASQAMAAMLYLEGVCYVIGWGPLPWIYVSEIFPTRTRHYGLALASASQWLWNFVISKQTPIMKTELGYKLFLMFASVNIGALAVFSLLIPETKGKSLEEMDIFGAVDVEQRQKDIMVQTLIHKQPHRQSPSTRNSISSDNKV